MRHALRFLPLAALLLPAGAVAAPATGFIGLPDCTNTISTVDSANGELYVLKIPNVTTSRSNDWLWNIEQKTEGASDIQATLDPGGFWTTGDVWATNQTPDDVAFAYITFAGGDIYVDSADSTVVDWGVVPLQQVGHSLPVGIDAGIGLAFPDTAAQYPVQTAPGVVRTFPVATPNGINIAFSPIAEVNTNPAAGGCEIGGSLFNPQDPTRGGIIGYNVYRLPRCGPCRPTPQDFADAIATDTDTDGGWIYFVDLRKFDVTRPDGMPNDLDPLDLVGLQNFDGRMYSGDEVLIFADVSSGDRVRPRAGELAPTIGIDYWYGLQPVVFGQVRTFANVGFTINDVNVGDHRMDLDRDGDPEAVSLNTTVAGGHDTPEFISPQAETENGAQDGLGLTHQGRPFISKCFFLSGTWPLPATTPPVLTGVAVGPRVELTLTTGLESADVLGYVVYRLAGETRVRVNDEPLLAAHVEGATHLLADETLKGRSARSVQYVVETLHADGSVEATDGPFTVSLEPASSRRRR